MALLTSTMVTVSFWKSSLFKDSWLKFKTKKLRWRRRKKLQELSHRLDASVKSFQKALKSSKSPSSTFYMRWAKSKTLTRTVITCMYQWERRRKMVHLRARLCLLHWFLVRLISPSLPILPWQEKSRRLAKSSALEAWGRNWLLVRTTTSRESFCPSATERT